MRKDVKSIFIERVNDLLQETNLTKKELSQKIKVPYSSVVSWLNGTRTIQIDSLCLVADYFCVSADYLLGREN